MAQDWRKSSVLSCVFVWSTPFPLNKICLVCCLHSATVEMKEGTKTEIHSIADATIKKLWHGPFLGQTDQMLFPCD